jgi:hypothetical protein
MYSPNRSTLEKAEKAREQRELDSPGASNRKHYNMNSELPDRQFIAVRYHCSQQYRKGSL